MSIFSVFHDSITWLLNTLSGPIRPFFNPFIGDRPLAVTAAAVTAAASSNAIGTSLTMEPRARLLPRGGSVRGGAGIFRSWNNSSTSQTEVVNDPPKSDVWQPAIVDVLKMRHILFRASMNGLPIELINVIFDYAEYWPHVSASKTKPIVARGASSHQDVLVIRTPPICALATAGCEDDSLGLPEPTLLHPVRKIVFRLRSHDQGYSSESSDTRGTYQASHTWFDTEIDQEFGPAANDEPLSRIPWDLSSTRFLNARPRHSHSKENFGSDKRARLSAKIAHNWVAWHQKTEPFHADDYDNKGELPTAAGEDQQQQQQQQQQHQQTSNNPEHPEVPLPRLFSHTYLQNHKYEVQYNVQAQSASTEHTVEWRYTDNISEDSPEAEALALAGRGKATGDGRFIRCLELGDCVSLWAKARYPNWANHVETATVEVYFAI